jgi:GMC oxidoreductase
MSACCCSRWAAGTDVPNVMEAGKGPLNQVRKRNYGFPGQPSFYLNGYCHESEAGLADKVLSGGSAPGSLAARHLLVVSRNYGVDNLRIADGSILPRVTTGNYDGPCVIIGERAGEMLKAEHKL